MLGYKKLLYSKLTNSFQAGVDTLYNKCKSCGSTPSSKTPTAISTAIQKLVETPYTKCKDCGATPTAKTNSAIVTAIGKIYTDRYNAGKTEFEGKIRFIKGTVSLNGDTIPNVTRTSPYPILAFICNLNNCPIWENNEYSFNGPNWLNWVKIESDRKTFSFHYVNTPTQTFTYYILY